MAAGPFMTAVLARRALLLEPPNEDDMAARMNNGRVRPVQARVVGLVGWGVGVGPDRLI